MDLVEKIRSGAVAQKSRAGFGLGQNWLDGGAYTPTPVGYHGAFADSATYALKAIKNLVWTSMANSKKYWEEVFDRWQATDQYREFQEIFEAARSAAENDYHTGGSSAGVVGRGLVAAHLHLLPDEVIGELGALYQEVVSR